ncbi:MobF family relaxase [Leptolyngbya sp. NIES-2104]|uniref:MobF family relaxase n=1 Tax=Leptolyngbya sp. NIES-2104 TaxID=1552121 RepID=UPI0006EC778A|nr:MobF family relaxase [Leptolyngbya sp. NIES-2104]GAP99636.1 IncW plasmid conjugative relaxase protein TrwC [Leptolyngbya sp. NIES-2104]
MLSLGRAHPQRSVHYFTQDNQSGSGIAELSQWCGQGAIALGCTGTVDAIAFSNVLSGLAPTGESLPGRQIHAHHQAGIDLTFNAPKSISLAALMDQQDALIAAHAQAIAQTLQIIEQRYAYTRLCEQGQRQLVPTQNLVIATFPHTTSRAHDPHLHTHCVVANLTQIANGEWRTIDNTGIYRDRSLLSAMYTNALADQVRQLGYEIVLRPDSHFELVGYEPEQLQHFSKRRQQILQLVGESATPAMKQWACLATRPYKTLNIDFAELNEWWQAQNAALQLEIRHPAPTEQSTISSPIDAIVMNAIATCTQTRSLFSQTELEHQIFDRVQPFSYEDFLETLQQWQQTGKLTALGNQYWAIPDRQSSEVIDVAPAIQAIAKGNVLNGFAQLLECDRVIESSNSSQAAIDAYLGLKPSDRAQSVLFIADEVERNQIQQDLAKAQQAHKSAITLWQLQPKPLTVPQALRLQSFQVNDVVVPRYHYPALGLSKGEFYTVVALHAKTFTLRDSSEAELTIAPRQFRKHLYRPSPMAIGLGDRLQWTTPHQYGSHFTIAAITDTTAAIRYSGGQIGQLDPNQSYFFQDARILTPSDTPPPDLKQLFVVDPVAISLTRWIQSLPALPDNLIIYSDRISALFADLRNASAKAHFYDSTPTLRSAKLGEFATDSQSAANRISELDSEHLHLAGNQSDCPATTSSRPNRVEEYARNLLEGIKRYSEQQVIEFVTQPLSRAITSLAAKLDETYRISGNQHRRTAALESAVRDTANLTNLVGQAIRTTEQLAATVIHATQPTSSVNAIASYDFKSFSSRTSTSAASAEPQFSNSNESARVRATSGSDSTKVDEFDFATPIRQNRETASSTAGETPSRAASANSTSIAAHLTQLLSQLQRWQETEAISTASIVLNPTLNRLSHCVNAAAIPMAQNQSALSSFLIHQQQFIVGIAQSLSHSHNLTIAVQSLLKNSHPIDHDRLPPRLSLTDRFTDLAHRAERAARRDRDLAHRFVQSARQLQSIGSESQRSSSNPRESNHSKQHSNRTTPKSIDYPTQPITPIARDLTRWHESVRDLFAQFPRRVEALHADETTEATRAELTGIAQQFTADGASQHSGLSGTIAAITATRSHFAASITDLAAGIHRSNASVTDYLANARSQLTAVLTNAHEYLGELARTIEYPYAIDHLADTLDRAVEERQRLSSEPIIFQSLEKSFLESTHPIFQSLENSTSMPVSVQSSDFSGIGWVTGRGSLNRVVLVETPQDAVAALHEVSALSQLDIARLEHSGRSLYLAMTDSVPKALQEWAAMPGRTTIAAGDQDFIRLVQKEIGRSQSLPVPDGFTWQKLLQMGHQNPAQLSRHYSQGLTGEPTAILLESAKRALRLGQPVELVQSMLMTAERVETMQPQQAEQYVQAIVDRACKSVSERQRSATQFIQRVESQRFLRS